jgi:hypothetical protein
MQLFCQDGPFSSESYSEFFWTNTSVDSFSSLTEIIPLFLVRFFRSILERVAKTVSAAAKVCMQHKYNNTLHKHLFWNWLMHCFLILFYFLIHALEATSLRTIIKRNWLCVCLKRTNFLSSLVFLEGIRAHIYPHNYIPHNTWFVFEKWISNVKSVRILGDGIHNGDLTNTWETFIQPMRICCFVNFVRRVSKASNHADGIFKCVSEQKKHSGSLVLSKIFLIHIFRCVGHGYCIVFKLFSYKQPKFSTTATATTATTTIVTNRDILCGG